MKTLYKVQLLIVFFTITLFADEFEIKSFEIDIKDLSARVESKKDVNDEYCAIIKIRTSIKNIQFDSNQLDDIIHKTGEYWVYVSPGIRHIEIFKDGFAKLGYTIPTYLNIESQTVYIMNLTNKNQTRLTIISKPIETLGATIYINGEKKNEVTPATFIVSPGTYSVTVMHSEFLEITRDVTVAKNERKDAIFNLMPSQVNIISNPAESAGASIFLNGIQQNNVTPTLFKLAAGKYFFTLKHPDFLDMTKETTLGENDNIDLVFNLLSYKGSTIQKYKSAKKHKWISMTTGIVIIGAGVACNYLGDTNYDKYNAAKTPNEAITAKTNTDQFYQYRDISYSVSIAPILYGLYCWGKESKYRKLK